MKSASGKLDGTGVAGREALQLPPLKMSLSTVYAWSRILAAYGQRHPRHQVRVYYHGHVIQDLRMLVRRGLALDAKGFEVRVETHNGHSADVPRLLRLMEEAGGPECLRLLSADSPELWFSPAADV
jgi:hypothetical protein